MVNLSLQLPEKPGETKVNTLVKVSIATRYSGYRLCPGYWDVE